MAFDQLGLYNNALILLGQRELSSLTEDRRPRHLLDGEYGRDSINFCLELIQPDFANTTTSSSGSASGSPYTYGHTLPSDYIGIVGVFRDSDTDDPVHRYAIEGTSLRCDEATVYITYTQENDTVSTWDASFFRVMAAFLAKQLASAIAPSREDTLEALFTKRVAEARELQAMRARRLRPKQGTTTLDSEQLDLYNQALTLMGRSELASTSDDSADRASLDRVWDGGATEYCLELIRPNFAAKVTTLTSPSAGSTLAYSHAKPSDYVTLVEDDDGTGAIYSDQALDQPVNRYVIDTSSILTDYATIYVHYISNSVTSVSAWAPSFRRVVSAYMARELALLYGSDSYQRVDEVFKERVAEARKLELAKVPKIRPSAAGTTLTLPWRKIYNDALLIMGLDEINANDDDSNRRAKIDRALNAGVVEALLEETGWSFARLSTKAQYDPSAEPAWGYAYAIAKPTDMHRLHGVYMDEYMRVPLKDYRDEGQYIFCDYTAVYFEYVDTDYLVNPSNWPDYFKRMVGARLAKEAAPSLRDEGADIQAANATWEEREKIARNNDAMQSPPQVIHGGNWLASRYNSNYRRRP